MIKESFLEMAKRHKAGDMLGQGEWQTCSVGCFNRDYGNAINDFAALADSTGYEEWTHHIQEAVFEGLPNEDAINWHVQFAEKMETVKDFDAFYNSFMVGVLEIALPHDKHGVVQPVIDLHKNFGNATPDDWKEVAEAARDAAAKEAAWAARAAWAAAWSAAWSAARAAKEAAWAAAWSAARADAWQKIKYAFLNAYGGE